MEKFKRRKNNEGITLISLIVTIIVIMIIATIGITTGFETADGIEATTLFNELQMIQSRVDVVYTQLQTGEKTLENIGGASYAERQHIMDRTFDAMNEEGIFREDYRYYTKQQIETYLGIENINQSVLINWWTRDVISVEGIEKDGVRYYRYEGSYKPNFSEEYQAVEYIESTGTQFIDTGFNPSNVKGYDIKYQVTGIKKSRNDYELDGIFGANSTTADTKIWFAYSTTANTGKTSFYMMFKSGVGNGNYSTTDTDLATYYSTIHHVTVKNDKMYYNGELVKEITSYGTPSTTKTMLLFAAHNDSAASHFYSKCKIYSAKIYDTNNNLIADYIPCYRKSDNEIGMYDLVTETLYTNQGTGEFIKGPNISNSEITSKNITLNTTKEINGNTKKVTVGVTTEDNAPVSNFTLKYKLEGEATYKIANGNYFETVTPGSYLIEVSGKGITAKEKRIDVYDINDYQKVEYIESTGTQYLDTKFVPTANTKIELDLSFAGDFDKSKGKAILGVTDGEKTYSVNFGSEDTQKTLVFFWVDITYASGATAYNINNTTTTISSRNMLTMQSGLASYGEKSKTIATKTNNQDSSLMVFGRKSDTGITPFGAYNMKVYNFKIYDNNTLVREFIPCYSKSDNTIGMYDLVNEVFYTNSGTGEFIKGEDI